MGGSSKRRRKSSPISSSADAMAAAGLAQGAEHVSALHVMTKFCEGLLPWTFDCEDRRCAVADLLDGRSMVLALDGASTKPLVVPSASGDQTDEHNSTSRNDGSPQPSQQSTRTTRASEASCAVDESKNESEAEPVPNAELFGFWMALSSHILSRLMSDYSSDFLAQTTAATADNDDRKDYGNSSDGSVSNAYRRVLSYISYATSCALYAPQSNPDSKQGSDERINEKWDRASTGPTRQWLARLVTTMASATAGHALSAHSGNKSSSGKSKGSKISADSIEALNDTALAAVTLCLENIVNAGGMNSSSVSSPSSSAVPSTQTMKTYWSRTTQPFLLASAKTGLDSDLLQSCKTAFANATGDWSCESKCVEILNSQPNFDALQNAFADLRQIHVPLRMEGRLAYRRWAAVVLDWYALAPSTLLHQSSAILQSPNVESTKLAIIGQWMNWIAEWASKSGVRPPGATLDQYLKQISLVRKKKRPDVRELSLKVALQAIDKHGATLQKGVIVNDKASEWELDLDGCYPFMATMLADLARVAGASSSTGGIDSVVEQIEHTAAALVVQKQIFEDAHLAGWALSRANVLLGQFESFNTNSYDHLLADPLVIAAPAGKPGVRLSPTLVATTPTSSRKRKSSVESSSLSSSLSQYDRFSLYLRAMHSHAPNPSQKSGSASSADIGRSFVDFLLKVAEACCDTRPCSAEKRSEPIDHEIVGRDTKRKLKAAVPRRSKRRKKDETASASSDDTENLSQATFDEDERQYLPISAGRSNLASVALDILRAILDSTHPASRRFQCLGAGVLGPADFSRIVELGQVLDVILLRSRNLVASALEVAASGSLPQSQSLTVEEKKVWVSIMNLCVTVGRGRLESVDSGNAKTPLTGCRLEIFKRVASVSKAVSIGKNAGSFPLWLPSAHFLLMSSNISRETEKGEPEADRFLVHGVLASIEFILKDPSILLPLNAKGSRETKGDGAEIPLSLQDTQLFLGAMSRLSNKEQSKVISSFIKDTYDALERLYADSGTSQLIKESKPLSSFLARLVTMCIYASVFSVSEEEVQRILLQILSTVAVGSPSFWLASEGYQLQGHFMGVLTDRESPQLPDCTIPGQLDPDAATNLSLLLRLAFKIGMSTAQQDNGYLLFSSWNAYSKASALWGASPAASFVSEIPTDCFASGLLVLRENICLVHRQIQMLSGVSPSNTINRAFAARVDRPSPQTIAQNVRLMVERGCSMIMALLDQLELPTADDGREGGAFVLLEGLCLYLSFAVSCMTLSKSSFVADTARLGSKRPRGYSTESEVNGSDAESFSSHDARVDALERVEEVCKVLGGAPSHPDWLDTGCSLRPGMAKEEAQNLALRVLEVVSRALKVSKIRQYECSLTALQENPLSADSTVLASLGLKLTSICSGEWISIGDEPSAEIAEICNVDKKVMKYLMDQTAQSGSISALATWCPNAATRACGHFYDLLTNQMVDISELGLAEMRVGGEWEVALSFCLTTACTGIPNCDTKAFSALTRTAILASSWWDRLASAALNALVPTSALVRFTAFGEGRKRHPLSTIDASVDDYQFKTSYVAEQIPPGSTHNERLRTAVKTAINLVSSSPLHNDPSAEIIAANLFVDPSIFPKLQTASSVGSSLACLESIVEYSSVLQKTRPPTLDQVVRRLIVDRLIRNHFDNEQSSGLGKFFLHQTQTQNRTTGALGGLGPLGGSVTPSSFGTFPAFASNKGVFSSLIFFLWNGSLFCDRSNRHALMVELGNLAALEMNEDRKGGLSIFMNDTWSKIPRDSLKSFLKEELFEGSPAIASSLSAIFASMLSSPDTNFPVLFFELIFELLQASCDQSVRTPTQALLLVFLYGTYCGQTGKISKWLLFDRTELYLVETFFCFLNDLGSVLKSKKGGRNLSKIAPRNSSCSYAVKEGFHMQHWYNCATCGLTDEKGCCTLCALVCHKGHDVVYARYSSFFCDCGAGAQDGSLGGDDQGCVCRCRLPLSNEDVEIAFSRGEHKEKQTGNIQKEAKASNLKSNDFAAVAAKCFRERSAKALKSAVAKDKDKWADVIGKLLKSEIENCEETRPPFEASTTIASYGEIRKRILASKTDLSTNVKSAPPFLSSVCASRERLLNCRGSPDRTNLPRSIVAADSRGRVIIAENGQITLLNGAAIPQKGALGGSGVLERCTLPIIGSESVDIRFDGLSINRENEKQFVAWNASGVYIFHLNNDSNVIEGRSELTFSDAISAIFKCQWVPSSSCYLSVGFSSGIYLFRCDSNGETSRSEKTNSFCLIPVVAGSTLRDYCIVSNNIFALLSDGTIHSIHLDLAEPDRIGQIGSTESFAEQLPGDGTPASLEFLAQSRVLISQNVSGGTIAFLLDDTCAIKRRLELLPEVFTVENEQVRGPHFHWNEMGLSRQEHCHFFRLTCWSHDLQSKSPVLLSIEFNEKSVKIGKVAMLESDRSIYGSSVFTVPIAENDRTIDDLPAQTEFFEKVSVCSVDDSGSLSLFSEIIFEEKSVPSSGSLLLEPPLLAFEGLDCIPGDELMYRIDSVKSSDLANKLQRDTESFFLSPRREGFTLTIAPRPKTRDFVVCGVRILVGRTSAACIPHRIYIGGRPIELEPGRKRWYSHVLSAQEIALAVRNGFVTISVTQPEEASNSPILDGIDVYGMDRSLCQPWLPQRLKVLHGPASCSAIIRKPKHSLGNLMSAANAFTSFRGVVKPSMNLSKEEKHFISDLVVKSTLGRGPQGLQGAIEALVQTVEPDESAQQTILDNSRLVACVAFLLKCRNRHKRSSRNFWQDNGPVLLECVRLASSIARERSTTYQRAINSNPRVDSIASLAAEPISELFRSIDHGELITEVTELSLTEIAVAGSLGYQENQNSLGSFVALQVLLAKPSNVVVDLTCEAIDKFCRKYATPKNLGQNADLFAQQNMIEAYACDRCQHIIRHGTRYTLPNDNHPFDLCRKCYDLAVQYASKNSYDETAVVIDGKTVGDDPELSCAEIKEMKSCDAGTEMVQSRQEVFDAFLQDLFNGLVNLINGHERKTGSAPVRLVQLVVGLVDLGDERRRVDRKKRIARELVHGMSLALDAAGCAGTTNSCNQSLLCYVQSLSQLVMPDLKARQFLSGRKASVVATNQDHNIRCVIHDNVKATRKHDSAKGDEFYVCSEEKCNFFKWAANEELGFDDIAAQHVWKLLSSATKEVAASVHIKLCEFLDKNVSSSGSVSEGSVSTNARNYEDAHRYIRDGVLCSHERLLPQTSDEFVNETSLLPMACPTSEDSWSALIESCVELLCLTGGIETDEKVRPWYPVLCKIIAEEKPFMRSLAKTALRRLCGKDDVYFAVRDYFSVREILSKVATELAWPLMTEAEGLVKRASRSSPQPNKNSEFSWLKGDGFELLGVRPLMTYSEISDDSFAGMRKLCNELLSIAKKRGPNFQRFCRQKSLVPGGSKRIGEQEMLSIPPIRILLYLASSVPSDVGRPLFKLMDVGIQSESSLKADQISFAEPDVKLFDTASDALGLNENNLYAFSMHFVMRGENAEIRRNSGSVAAKLIKHAQIQQSLALRLIAGPLGSIGELGRDATEFTNLLNSIVDNTPAEKVEGILGIVESFWCEQMKALRHDRANHEYHFFETRIGQSTQKKRFDLSPCSHCQCAPFSGQHGKRSQKPSSGDPANADNASENGLLAASPTLDTAGEKKHWLENQISSFVRCRVESVRDAHASNEFSTFLMLKHRLCISDVFVEVHDPRARFVKTIKVHASSRAVESVGELKNDVSWYSIATLNLSRGGSRASFSLDKPILAANLKIEYVDFYERPGGSRAADGTLIIHCPRCARIVNNAHGVCSSCGEVAFQCRKCRHINYDRLDAFLCVECGYCASGSFSYEINAGIASNADAITNERDYCRALRMVELSTRLYDDILHCFRDQYMLAAKAAKKTPAAPANLEFPTEGLAAAYFDSDLTERHHPEFTSDLVGKQGSVVKALARPSTFSMLSSESMDHYRSVLALCRSSVSQVAGRGRGRDLIIRHVGRDTEEDENDLIGLLESTDSLARVTGLDPSDPLSRLLASVQSRREQRNENQEGRTRRRQASHEPASSAEGGGLKGKSVKDLIQVCEKLHILLRESERETFQLRRRIAAWRSLDRGDLAGTDNLAMGNESCLPSHCWNCSASIAGHLLLLWIRLFQAAPRSVTLSENMIRLLLQDEQFSSKTLSEGKRMAVCEIALKSERGAAIIHEALQLRLKAGQVSASEILGQIVTAAAQGGSPLKDKFMALVKTELEAIY